MVPSPYTTTQLGTNPTDNGGCFRQGPGRIDTDAGSLSFDTANMQINQTYVFKIQVRKDERVAETTAEIEIVQGDPPELTIRYDLYRYFPESFSLVISYSSSILKLF